MRNNLVNLLAHLTVQCLNFDNNSLQLTGGVEFTQSFITGSHSNYVVYLRGHNIQGRSYSVGLTDKCYGCNYYVNVILICFYLLPQSSNCRKWWKPEHQYS